MSKKLKIFLILTLLFAVFGFVGYNYVMRGGARNLAEEDTAFTTTSTSILEEFTKASDVANAKYLEKAIAVTGKITSVTPTDVTIDDAIICALTVEDKSLKNDQKVTVKGRVVGFDDLMGELKLDQCFIIKN